MVLSISEIFTSIQGEGATMGCPSIFIRLGGCNLLCGGKGTEKDKLLHDGATWRCDTIEVWRKSKSVHVDDLISLLEIEHNLSKHIENGGHIIITGGEPLMQKNAVDELRLKLYDLFSIAITIEIETNGTILPIEDFNLQYNISPKLSNSGEPLGIRYFPETLKHFTSLPNACFKFVIFDQMDIIEMEEMFPFIPKEKIWLMPAASHERELKANSKWLVKECIAKGYKYSSRLQVAIWNETTGV